MIFNLSGISLLLVLVVYFLGRFMPYMEDKSYTEQKAYNIAFAIVIIALLSVAHEAGYQCREKELKVENAKQSAY